MELTDDIARNFARIVLGHVTRPYPYKDDHVFESDEDVRAPRVAHPVFFGSFDWHARMVDLADVKAAISRHA